MTAATHAQFEPGHNPTVVANEDLVAARLLKVNGTYADGGNIPVEYCDGGAGVAPDYISGHDILTGAIGHARSVDPGLVAEIECGGTVADGALVKCTTDGKVVAGTATGDVVIGRALRGNTNGNRALVKVMAPSVIKIA